MDKKWFFLGAAAFCLAAARSFGMESGVQLCSSKVGQPTFLAQVAYKMS